MSLAGLCILHPVPDMHNTFATCDMSWRPGSVEAASLAAGWGKVYMEWNGRIYVTTPHNPLAVDTGIKYEEFDR